MLGGDTLGMSPPAPRPPYSAAEQCVAQCVARGLTLISAALLGAMLVWSQAGGL